MNCLFNLLLLFLTIGKAPSIALLDRSFQKPVTYTDSVTLEALGKGAFPIYLHDAKQIVETVEHSRKKINQNRYDNMETDRIHIGNSVLILNKKTSRHIRKYQLILGTESNGFTTYIELIKGDFDRAAQQRVISFLDYLKDNIPVLNNAVSISN